MTTTQALFDFNEESTRTSMGINFISQFCRDSIKVAKIALEKSRQNSLIVNFINQFCDDIIQFTDIIGAIYNKNNNLSVDNDCLRIDIANLKECINSPEQRITTEQRTAPDHSLYSLKGHSYIYLIEGMDTMTQKFFYKVGRTQRRPDERFKEHGYNHRFVFIQWVRNCIDIETVVKKTLRLTNGVHPRNDLGTEYFECGKGDEGDDEIMIDIIRKCIKENKEPRQNPV
jgi:hypothetical protein